MSRPTSKQQLLETAESQFHKLWQIIDDMPVAYKRVEFDFPTQASKKAAHWQRDKNIRDLVVHLYEWYLLLLLDLNQLTSAKIGKCGRI